jgi:integrase/recombinase XerC/integrase/recombinase XerD
MAPIDQLIATYLTACEVEGKTPNTIASYRASLADFRRVGERRSLPCEVGAYGIPDVYAFLQDLRDRGASPAYQHRRHREVKAFFSWCRRMGYLQQNVFARVPLVKLEQQIIQPFSPAEVQRLLDSLDRSRLTGCRNYALFLFLLDTGVRASECVSIQLGDVDWEQQRVRVLQGKGKKQRWVGFGQRTGQSLRDYISGFRGDEPGPLFLSSQGNPLATHALNVIMNRIAARSGLTKVHPHRFRHTFATWAIRSNAREIDVQSLLGHSSLTMVQRYARTYSSEQAVQAHAHFSPVKQLG